MSEALLLTVQQVLGHASMVTTADVYSHVTPVASREVAERMDRALGGAS